MCAEGAEGPAPWSHISTCNSASTEAERSLERSGDGRSLTDVFSIGNPEFTALVEAEAEASAQAVSVLARLRW